MEMLTLLTVFFLLIVYQVKHFICDFPLQGKFMLGKFKPGWDFLLPLTAHCAVHAAATFLIVVVICGRTDLSWLALVDFSVHFIVDRIKAGPKYLGRYKALSSSEFLVLNREKERYESLSEEKIHPEIKSFRKSVEKSLSGNRFFWWSLGLDQAVHHLTHYAIIFVLVMK